MKGYKNILLVTSEFPPLPGGIGNHAFNLAKNLQKNNFDLTVIADYRNNDVKEEQEFDKINSFKTIRIKRYNLLLLTYLQRLIKYLQLSKENDIILASGKFPLWLIGLTAFINSKPKIAIIHGTEVNFTNIYFKKITELSLKKFDKVIAVSNYTKGLIKGLHLMNVVVIPNGFDDKKFKILKNSNIEMGQILQGYPKIITVGNVSDRKGQANVIKALPLVLQKFPDLHYHMVGIPSQKDKFLQLAKELNIEKSITFHGKVSDSFLTKALQEADIFAMLSENTLTGDVEGFGIAILEANYFGLPAIGSKDCGIEDAIDNHRSGILINNKSQIEFGDAIDEILNNKDKYREYAQEWIDNYKWDLIVEKYVKYIYEK